MATLGAQLGCEQYLASTVVTGAGQRSSTLLAELCLSTVLVLALLAFHCRPQRKKRARCTATVTSRMADCSARAARGHVAAAPQSAASNSRRPMMTVTRAFRARCVEGTIPRLQRAVFAFEGAGCWLLRPQSWLPLHYSCC